VTTGSGTEDLLRELTPRVLGAVVRRYGDFADAEDAVQEALLAAATQWPTEGRPDNPLGWLIRVASRRMADQYERDDARRRREDLAASWSQADANDVRGQDDTLILTFMCCHPSLPPASAIPLTLRAVGGLTTREIASAFLVPEATMGQRITRAKAKIKSSGAQFRLPSTAERVERLRTVLHVLYLVFNEGYAASSGPALARADLSGEAIRLTRLVHAALRDDPEVAGLLALMLLIEARRPARVGPAGELVPLAEQDRARWDRDLVAEGVALVTDALAKGAIGEYQLQAAINAVHDQAASPEDTNWGEILALYGLLERITGNPMVSLNRAVAVAMVHGPAAGLELLDGVADRLGDHHRLHSVRGHLYEMAGDRAAAVDEFRIAAAGTISVPERDYLVAQAARLANELGNSRVADRAPSE
jgi:RNA polymerase sigma factor (sigma-70 family)